MVAAAAVASHATALGAGFIWLDHAHLEGKLALASRGRWLELFTQGFAGTGFYRPLMALSLSIDALIGGPLVFHVSSIAWHTAASLATVAAGGALGLNRRSATLAGLLFAVHPLSGLVADAIAFRSEAMLATFLLGFLWAHLSRRSAIAASLLVAACLTKETAYVLGPLFILATGTASPAAASSARDGNKSVLLRVLGAEAVAFGVAVLLRAVYAPPFRAAHESLGVGDALGTRFGALARSVALLAFPIDLTVCDASPVLHSWSPASLAGLGAALALVWMARRRRGPALLLVLALLPSMQIVPVMRWWSPHYVYVPAAFAAMLVAEVAERRGGRALTGAGVAAALLGSISLVDGRKYASDETLWTGEVARRGACREGQFYLGEIEREARRWDAAARRYEAALAPRPGAIAYVDRGAALQNLGTARLEQRRFDEARTAFREALEGATTEDARRDLVHNLAAVAFQTGDAAEADRLLAPETARPDARTASIQLRALALDALGRADEAAELRARVTH